MNCPKNGCKPLGALFGCYDSVVAWSRSINNCADTISTLKPRQGALCLVHSALTAEKKPQSAIVRLRQIPGARRTVTHLLSHSKYFASLPWILGPMGELVWTHQITRKLLSPEPVVKRVRCAL
jgi:hypothetical protein